MYKRERWTQGREIELYEKYFTPLLFGVEHLQAIMSQQTYEDRVYEQAMDVRKKLSLAIPTQEEFKAMKNHVYLDEMRCEMEQDSKAAPIVFFADAPYVRRPTRTGSRAGYDIYFKQPADRSLVVDKESSTFCRFQPGITLVPTQVRYKMLWASSHALVFARSSANKVGLMIQGVLDSDYEGEIFLTVHNTGKEDVMWDFENAIAQVLVYRTLH